MNEIEGFAKIDVTPKRGDEPFYQNRRALDIRLIDFWRWSASDLVNNTTRGILAEYIVACALKINTGVRVEWDAYDLLIPPTNERSEIRIEVKSAAYLQSWEHRKLSNIIFNIRPTRGWNSTTNERENDLKRQGDVYVFCHLKHEDKDSVDPLNLEQWDFYILSASILNERFPTQKSISLSSLRKLNPCQAKYEEITTCIKRLSL